MGEAIVKRNRYSTATCILAILALLWMPVGFYLFEVRMLFFDFSDLQGVSHWGSPFYMYYSGLILLLSGLGILLGLVNRKKNNVWSVGFFINVIVFSVVLGFSF